VVVGNSGGGVGGVGSGGGIVSHWSHGLDHSRSSVVSHWGNGLDHSRGGVVHLLDGKNSGAGGGDQGEEGDELQEGWDRLGSGVFGGAISSGPTLNAMFRGLVGWLLLLLVAGRRSEL